MRQQDSYGYVNKHGKYEVSPQFDFAGSFYTKIAPVKNVNKWGLINKKGEFVVNPKFDEIKTKNDFSSYEDNIVFFLNDIIENDYYDASEFINRFFERDTGDAFDGINVSTNLMNLSYSQIYGDCLNANTTHRADCRRNKEITEDISINNVSFHFNTPIFKNVTNYDRWGYRTGTRREYDFTAKPVFVEYNFTLSQNASGKGNAVAIALKTEMEHRYGLQTVSERGKYSLYQGDGKLNFAIIYDKHYVSIHVAFNKADLKTDRTVAGSVELNEQFLSIDSFSTYPPEFEGGCSYSFSNNSVEFKQGQYIFLCDMSTAFLKVNGVFTKLTLIRDSSKEMGVGVGPEKYKNENFEMIIEYQDGGQLGYESSWLTGTIKLKEIRSGKTIVKSFYGTFGC